MKVISKITEMQQFSTAQKRNGHKIAVVPTMGCLHEGHLRLIDKAKKHADLVIVTIFVNPSQFGPNEDFDKYPRTFDNDRKACQEHGADVIFAPHTADIYPKPYSTWVNEDDLSTGLCGASREGHFRGVTTIVSKLFNITLPDIAVFGQKDAQQALIIKRMVKNLNFPIEIIIAPIVREADGLALSSRNRYLSDKERKSAPTINSTIQTISKNITASAPIDEIFILKEKEFFTKKINAVDGIVDYIEILDSNTLENINDKTKEVLIATAVFFGKTRLIDNEIINYS